MIELKGYRDKHEYTNKHGVKSVVYLMDCMEAMAQMGDNEFSLACIDPPYGIKASKMNLGNGKKKYEIGKDWDDSIPNDEYFIDLIRVSSNQIIWGGNYFKLPPTSCFLIWDKMHGDGVDFADVEFAWTSFSKVAKRFSMRPMNMDGGKIHPTQKPIALYDWILHKYAKPNDSIFDSHLGSGSSRIAADKHNLPFLGTETDADYFHAHCKRFDNYTAQLTLF